MCLMLRGCFPRRRRRTKECFSGCWHRICSRKTMRTDTCGIRNFLPRKKWFGFGTRNQPQPPAVNNNTSSLTDGSPLPQQEEPQPVILTYEQMFQEKLLSEAGQLLIEKEERLFRELKESDAFTHHEEQVNQLKADRKALQDLVLQTLGQSLCLEEDSLAGLTSAVKAVMQEEDQDLLWKQRDQTPPSWRPSGWRKLHDSTLLSLVKERMENPSTPSACQIKLTTIQADITNMGRQLKEDLLSVVGGVKRCYPQEMDICNFYSKLYHQTLSASLMNIADFGLVDKDRTFLLRWVNEYYPEILAKPQLHSEIDSGPLGKLLPERLLKSLEDEYLSNQQGELTTIICRVLGEEREKWNKGEEPETEDGCFFSPVAYDIIQLINGKVTSSTKVLGDPHKAQRITCHISKDLMDRYKSFQSDVIKQNKANSRSFIKANLDCIKQFSEVLNKERHLFTEDVRKNCLRVLTDMKQSAHTYLLQPLHERLKPQYRKLGTSDWLHQSEFKELLDGINKEGQDLQGSTESCHKELMGQLEQEVTVEYVRRLLKGKVKLKDKMQQLKAYLTVKDNAENLHHLFVQMGSEEDWLKEILFKIAEVLKLQDLPAIQMQVVLLGTDYPDLSEKHVLALLKLKTDLTKADRKSATDILHTLREIGSNTQPRSFFSLVQVK
ncbi:tumor necrosis factor alpha-induced protein 2-like isoform X1 [Gymnodraco acuticeps]|uniref:Tumor necrosis factor alpha-induced protein 2-like isoform X1 n=2 Tax=Gymnodraco acuticeps TaxID=8218 RepID=A0A6P8VZ25_GYMAC|nr:tumor necrosis factor alpha-induced protein 2-like isoform X1 [Gymnodraco acuticeps]